MYGRNLFIFVRVGLFVSMRQNNFIETIYKGHHSTTSTCARGLLTVIHIYAEQTLKT